MSASTAGLSVSCMSQPDFFNVVSNPHFSFTVKPTPVWLLAPTSIPKPLLVVHSRTIFQHRGSCVSYSELFAQFAPHSSTVLSCGSYDTTASWVLTLCWLLFSLSCKFLLFYAPLCVYGSLQVQSHLSAFSLYIPPANISSTPMALITVQIRATPRFMSPAQSLLLPPPWCI